MKMPVMFGGSQPSGKHDSETEKKTRKRFPANPRCDRINIIAGRHIREETGTSHSGQRRLMPST